MFLFSQKCQIQPDMLHSALFKSSATPRTLTTGRPTLNESSADLHTTQFKHPPALLAFSIKYRIHASSYQYACSTQLPYLNHFHRFSSFCNIINIFTITDPVHASLLKKLIILLTYTVSYNINVTAIICRAMLKCNSIVKLTD